MNRIIVSIAAAAVVLLLQACGGGGGGGSDYSGPVYTGSLDEARVEDTNAESLSTAAASGAAQSVVADSAGGAITPRSTPSPESKLVEISPKIAQWIAGSGALYSARTEDLSSYICDAGGSAIADTNSSGSAGTITFVNCGISDGVGDVVRMSGTVDFTGTYDSYGDPSTLNMVMHVTVSYAGETTKINMTLNCVGLSSTPSCTVTSDFVGIDGRIYRVADISVTDDGTGYYVDATVYDPDYGRVDMTTTAPLVFDCSNGVPSTGTVVISGTDSTSGTITFDSCSTYTVTIGGVAMPPYTWP